MAYCDNDDDEHRIFQFTEQSPIADAVAPITVFVAAQSFAEGSRIGCAADAVIRVAANLNDCGRAEVAGVARRHRFNLLVPAHATPSLR